MTDTYYPIKTFITVFTFTLISGVSTLALMGCDRTEPVNLTDGVAVDIAQTDPLVAGESVGDVDVEIEKLNTIDPTVQTEVEAKPTDMLDTNSTQTLPPQGHQLQSLVADKPSVVIIDTIDNDDAISGSDSPELTLINAMNALYYGDAKASATYYQTDIPDFANQLEVTQTAFQKTVENIVIKQVTTNDAGDVATIEGEINLVGSDTPEPAQYTLQKVDGAWKILG